MVLFVSLVPHSDQHIVIIPEMVKCIINIMGLALQTASPGREKRKGEMEGGRETDTKEES